MRCHEVPRVLRTIATSEVTAGRSQEASFPFGRGGSSRTLRLENLEARHLLTVALTWSGPGTALDLTENTAGATPAIAISEPSPRVGVLKIDLGAGCSFAGGSTTSATGLTYQNAGSQHNVQSPSSSNFVPPQFGQMGCQRAASPTSSSQSARRRSSIAGEKLAVAYLLADIWNSQNIGPQVGRHWANTFMNSPMASNKDLFNPPVDLLVYFTPQPGRRSEHRRPRGLGQSDGRQAPSIQCDGYNVPCAGRGKHGPPEWAEGCGEMNGSISPT